MSYTSSEVKQRWNEQHYKAVHYPVQKDIGDAFAETCRSCGVSYRSIIIDIITEYLERGKLDE